MKTLTKFALAALILCSVFTVSAQGYYRSTTCGYRSSYGTGYTSSYGRSSGIYVAPYYRSNSGSYGGYASSSRVYVYRNPYAANPSVSVRGYTRYDGTVVLPYYRTPANNTLTDNLNYRGYGTVRLPR